MSTSSEKSIGLTLREDDRLMVLSSTAYEVDGKRVKPSCVEQTVEYLGLAFNSKGRALLRPTGKLEPVSQNIAQAPPKPHQYPDILARFGLSKPNHELILGMAHRRTLKRVDIIVR
ncbi:hypothetical protein D915_001628 [Fasciola hepatica]|uniref:Uncharacterized protein n=1 Tax=Fasciola hepatica TaxID=6192 RepID=A0A4E0S3K1_FASHE|nr:hypothetical protein D915_001628 [Fasciola hepatica]